MENTLIVAETFYSLQGEGITSGMPAVFLRLGGCNLNCTWCDTVEVWKHGKAKKFEDVFNAEQWQALERGANLIITGGEPLLHQSAIVNFLDWLTCNMIDRAPGSANWIEIETNGTILPLVELDLVVDQYNVSPKLSNSNEPASKRINEVALIYFATTGKSQFKFVVAKEDEELEIIMDFLPYLNSSIPILMPAGATQEELSVTRPIVAEICKRMHWRFTDRMHVSIWNKKTGV